MKHLYAALAALFFAFPTAAQLNGGVIPPSSILSQPQTVSGAWTFAGTTTYTAVAKTTPRAGGTVTFASGQRTALIVPAGTLATLTITLPACAAGNDGDERNLIITQIITAVTIGASAGSVVGAPGSLAVGGGETYHCYGADTAWYRMN